MRYTSYWLGDIRPLAAWDGNVNITDLAAFSAAFGTSDGDAGWDNEADFGPTDDWSRFGIPLPDNSVQFEDLMVFAMNYGNVGPAGVSPRVPDETEGTLSNRVTVRLVPRASDGGTTTYALVLDNGATASLKGVSVRVAVGVGSEVTAVRAAGVANRSDVFVGRVDLEAGKMDVCTAALGINRPLSGSGVIAEIDVQGVTTTSEGLRIEIVDLRDIDNQREEVTVNGKPDGFVPTVYGIGQNVPNPFNPITTITYDVSTPGVVRINIYDVAGRLVRNLVDESAPAGRYDAVWDGRDNRGASVHSGVYFYRMTAPGYQSPTKKMLLLK